MNAALKVEVIHPKLSQPSSPPTNSPPPTTQTKPEKKRATTLRTGFVANKLRSNAHSYSDVATLVEQDTSSPDELVIENESSEYEVSFDSDASSEPDLVVVRPVNLNKKQFSIRTEVRGYEKRVCTEKGSPYVAYVIKTTLIYKKMECSWCTARRYNEFRALHKTFMSVCSHLDLPVLPSKRILTLRKFDTEFIESRRKALDAYLKQLVVVNKKAKLDCLFSFLDIENCPLSYLFDKKQSGLLEKYKTIRKKKRRVKKMIEMHNQELKKFESESSSQTDQVDENLFYKRFFEKKERLQKELEAIYLQGDQFELEMDNTTYIMIVTSESKVYIFSKPDKQIQVSDSIPLSEEEQIFKTCRGKKFMLFVDEIRSIVTLNNTYRGDNFEAMTIKLKNGNQFVFYALERQHIYELLGAHIKRVNKARIRMVNYLKQLWKLKETNFDEKDPEHLAMLRELWYNVFPEEKLLVGADGRRSGQWEKLGFQCDDPISDFRAMGLLSLTNMLYFTRNHVNLVRLILKKKANYPLYVSGIHVTLMMLDMLNLKKVVDKPAQSSSWCTPMFNLLCLDESSYPFEELFCLICELLDKIFEDRKAGYMDYPKIYNETREIVQKVLEKRPSSLKIVKYLFSFSFKKSENF